MLPCFFPPNSSNFFFASSSQCELHIFFGFFRISFSVSLLAPFGDRGWPPPTVFACEVFAAAFGMAFAAAFGMAFAAANVLLHRFTNVLLHRFTNVLLHRFLSRALSASLLHSFTLDRRLSLTLLWSAPSALVVFFPIYFSFSLLDPFGGLGLPPPTVFACEVFAASFCMSFAASNLLLYRFTNVLLHRFTLDRRLSLTLLWCAPSALVVFFPITSSVTARLLWLLRSLSFDRVLRLFGDLLVGDLLLVAASRRHASYLGRGFNSTLVILTEEHYPLWGSILSGLNLGLEQSKRSST